MDKAKEYMLLIEIAPMDIVKQVNKLISEGWQPLGGIAVALSAAEITADGHKQHTMCMQAMVK